MPNGYNVFLFFTEQFGQVNFTIPPEYSEHQSQITVDFDTLSVTAVSIANETWIQTVFAYDNNTKNFTAENSSKINTDNVDPTTFFPPESNKIYAADQYNNKSITVFDLLSISANTYPVKYFVPTPSVFYDGQGGANFILSETFSNSPPYTNSPYLLDSGVRKDVPGANNYTAAAKAAGRSSYFVADHVGSTIQIVRMYLVNQDTRAIVY